MKNPDGVHYRAHYSNGPDDNSIFHLYFDDQAQADKACEAVFHANRESVVMIQTRYGKATLSLNYNFVGLFPSNTGEPVNQPAATDDARSDNILVQLAPADEDEDLTDEERRYRAQ